MQARPLPGTQVTAEAAAATSPRLPWDRVQNQEAGGKPFIFFSEAMCHVVSFSEVPTNQ